MHFILCGGGRGIRTLGTFARTTVFETAPFNRSGTPPQLLMKVTDSLERFKSGEVNEFLRKLAQHSYVLQIKTGVVMKNYPVLRCLIILSLMFSSDLLAGKRNNHCGKNKGTVTRKVPPSPPHEEKALVPLAPPLPPSSFVLEGGKENSEDKNKEKLSRVKGAKALLKAKARAFKNIVQVAPITDQLLSQSRLGLKSVVVEHPSSFVSPELRLLQSVLLKSVPLNQKPQAIGGEQVKEFPSLLAQRRGADFEKALKAKANAGLENHRIWQSIKESSADPKRKALLGELERVVSAKKRRVEESTQLVSESQLMEQSWIEVAREDVQPSQQKPPSQTSWVWRIIGYK